MSFISYAQNCEDVLLWRALGQAGPGFYIDVGANDPLEHSVTKAFYDAGWRGINIEPLPAFHQAFLSQRPRDINLAVAAGAERSQITLFDVPAVNGWASSDPQVAAAHRAEGFEVVELQVPLRTLNDICAEHVDGPIHFLKIDVEGFEGEVLRGIDLQRWRPWVLVIEATLPNSRLTNHDSWEALVTAHDYLFAYFDGLNRYYVAAEQRQLQAALALQPNVFDDFMSCHLAKAWRELGAQGAALEAQGTALGEARARAYAAEAENEQLRQRTCLAEAEAQRGAAWGSGLEQQLLAIHASRSWRLAAPLRVIEQGRLGGICRARAAALARRLLSRLGASEPLRRLVLPLLTRFPALRSRLAQIGRGAPPRDVAVPAHLINLTPAERAVLADLTRAPDPAPEEH